MVLCSWVQIFKWILKLYNGLYFNICILMCFRWWLYVLCYGLYHKYGPITKPTSFLIGLVFCYPWYKLHSCLVSIQQLLCLGNAMSGFVWCLRWRLFAFPSGVLAYQCKRAEIFNFVINKIFKTMTAQLGKIDCDVIVLLVTKSAVCSKVGADASFCHLWLY